jgi:hypothetical protein
MLYSPRDVSFNCTYKLFSKDLMLADMKPIL